MRVALLIDFNFASDQRVLREAKCITSWGHQLVIYAFKDKSSPDEEKKDNYTIKRIFTRELFTIRNTSIFRKTFEHFKNETFDVMHCHDHYMLQIGAKYKKKHPKSVLIYESRELFKAWPVNTKGGGLYLKLKSDAARYLDRLREKTDARHIDFLITVNNSIAKILNTYFHLKNSPVVLRNVMEFEEMKEKSDLLRQQFSIPQDCKILVYIGNHIYRKKLNIETALIQFAGNKELALVFITDNDTERKYFEGFVRVNNINNVYFKDLIKRHEFLPVVGSADAGLITTWNKKALSYWLALDNKLFIYIMSELPVLTTTQPEYIDIVEGNNIGICVNGDEPDCFKKGWDKLLANYAEEKKNTFKLKQVLNWDNEQQKLKELYAKIEMKIDQ